MAHYKKVTIYSAAVSAEKVKHASEFLMHPLICSGFRIQKHASGAFRY